MNTKINYSQTTLEDILGMISEGKFFQAERIISREIQNCDDSSTIEKLKFELIRMDRIKLDFQLSGEELLNYIKKYIPDCEIQDLTDWEEKGWLEYKIIDGEKLYFNRAHTNFFLLNPEAKAKKNEIEGVKISGGDKAAAEIIPEILSQKTNYCVPKKFRIKYELTVDKDVIPAGETIRVWLPYPRDDKKRQTNIELINTSQNDFIISSDNKLHKAIYMEGISNNGTESTFSYELNYQCFSKYFDINVLEERNITDIKISDQQFIHEREPHIVFSDDIKQLSQDIIGNTINKVTIAKKIFEWISNNIPWAGAREYSTIRSIPQYCINRMHGDCGIKTLLFITLCRYNGIPAKWESGWMLHPGEVNLHDWAEIYFEETGWIPVDMSFGLQNSEDPGHRYFYLGGLDPYRYIINDGYSDEFFPKKKHFRSETVDFQRGEVEWKGGNLYFDKWKYKMEVEYLD